MNHTIKGIIIVVTITSMLFVGATSMFPIMQNSFAHKKSDFKGADPNTNTDTNTNSADSTSSSDATADNKNNIDNTATASSNQNQNACAVAVTCPEGSTTIIPPATGTLTIEKECDPSCPDSTFSIKVTGNNPQPSSFNLNNGDTRAVTLGPSSFTVHENPVSGFSTTFTGDCTQTGVNSPDATGTIRAGQTLHCTITNTPTTGTLTITKKCLPMFPPSNDCPGKTFSIQVTGNNPQPSSFTLGAGESKVVTLGTGSFTITITLTGFLSINGPDCSVLKEGVSATGTIIAGQNLSCTITNFV